MVHIETTGNGRFDRMTLASTDRFDRDIRVNIYETDPGGTPDDRRSARLDTVTLQEGHGAALHHCSWVYRTERPLLLTCPEGLILNIVNTAGQLFTFNT